MQENQRNAIVVTLATNDNSKSLVFSEFSGKQLDPHQCKVQIISGPFSFEGSFFFDNFSEFAASIEKMAENLTGSAELKEHFNDRCISFNISKLGHVKVSGIMEEGTQKLLFDFSTDQTCLGSFGKDLRKVME